QTEQAREYYAKALTIQPALNPARAAIARIDSQAQARAGSSSTVAVPPGVTLLPPERLTRRPVENQASAPSIPRLSSPENVTKAATSPTPSVTPDAQVARASASSKPSWTGSRKKDEAPRPSPNGATT